MPRRFSFDGYGDPCSDIPVEGAVRDSSGASIAGAQVVLHSDRTPLTTPIPHDNRI